MIISELTDKLSHQAGFKQTDISTFLGNIVSILAFV